MLNLGPFELRLGKKFVFTALEEAVRSMRVGEVAVFSLPEPVRRYLDGVFSPHLSLDLYPSFLLPLPSICQFACLFICSSICFSASLLCLFSVNLRVSQFFPFMKATSGFVSLATLLRDESEKKEAHHHDHHHHHHHADEETSGPSCCGSLRVQQKHPDLLASLGCPLVMELELLRYERSMRTLQIYMAYTTDC